MKKKPSRSVPSEYYTEAYYRLCNRGYEEFRKGGISQRLIFAFNLADLKKGMDVLDIGAGRGELAVECAKKGAFVKAIDYSQAAIEIAKENLEKRVDKKVAKRVVFKRMNAKKLLYPKKSFDVVFMLDVVEHLYPEELKLTFLEIKRVLKPGGKAIIHTSNAWLVSWTCFLTKIFFQLKETKEHVNDQSYFSLRQNLKLLGGEKKVFFRPRRNCFSEPAQKTKSLPSWAIRLAGFLDKLWDNKIILLFVYHTPLVFFLGTDLWAVVKIPQKDKSLK